MITDVLILDTETTGVDSDDICVEVACALYHLPSASILTTYSSLIHPGDKENRAEFVNEISKEALDNAFASEYVWKRVNSLVAQSAAILAHNAEFDQRFCPKWDVPWICTMGDVEWPKRSSPRDGLVKLVLAHGLGVSHAHRAMADVDLICRLLSRTAQMGVDLVKLMQRALRPKARYVSLEPYQMKDEVKKAGFGWDGKVWSRTMFIEEAEELTFKMRRE